MVVPQRDRPESGVMVLSDGLLMQGPVRRLPLCDFRPFVGLQERYTGNAVRLSHSGGQIQRSENARGG